MLTALFVLLLYIGRVTASPISRENGFTVAAQRGVPHVSTSGGAERKINVNTAGAEELQILHGIGEVKAQAIIAERETNGPFTCAEDLLRVPGIGEKTLESIKDDITWEVKP